MDIKTREIIGMELWAKVYAKSYNYDKANKAYEKFMERFNSDIKVSEDFMYGKDIICEAFDATDITFQDSCIRLEDGRSIYKNQLWRALKSFSTFQKDFSYYVTDFGVDFVKLGVKIISLDDFLENFTLEPLKDRNEVRVL